MTKEQKEQIIKNEWEKKIKNNPHTSAYWDKNIFSFTKWSIKKVRSENHKLVQIVKGDDWTHSNVKWMEQQLIEPLEEPLIEIEIPKKKEVKNERKSRTKTRKG